MIVLIGFMGAGKTTVGQLLADRLGRQFTDSDHVIEAGQGVSIPDIFETRGEAAFRQVEAETITGLLAGPDVVLAVGGGALTTRQVREALAGHQVVLLDVALAEALERVASDPGRPMLHRPDVSGLYNSRIDGYRAAADVVVPVSGRSPSEVADDVISALVPVEADPGGVGE
jgi:shikimate kinase